MQGLGFGVQGLAFRIQALRALEGSGFRVQRGLSATACKRQSDVFLIAIPDRRDCHHLTFCMEGPSVAQV